MAPAWLTTEEAANAAEMAMWDTLYTILTWAFFIAFIATLVVAGAMLLRDYLATGSVSSGLANTLFAPKPQKRLEVVDHANVDGRRRLVLIRRDDVEHLIMTGGPVDVVIETGIGQDEKRPKGRVVEGPTAVFSRPGRALGQAVGEK